MLNKFTIISSLLLLLSFGNASATVIAEIPDAGETLGTAQNVGAISSGDSITGTTSGDADLFGFSWSGGGFYANTVGSTGDTQLFLFDSVGAGIQANDDGIAFAGPAYLQLAALAAGNYYIGMSGFNYDPYDTNVALMFTSSPYQPLYGPLPGTTTLASWSGGSSSSSYSINFQQIDDQGNPIPEPSSILLLGLGLLGFGLGRKKQRSA